MIYFASFSCHFLWNVTIGWEGFHVILKKGFKNTVIQLVAIISSFSFLDNLETVVKHLKVEHNHLIQILLGAIVIKMSIIDP